MSWTAAADMIGILRISPEEKTSAEANAKAAAAAKKAAKDAKKKP